jgi:formyl-CoA transferase
VGMPIKLSDSPAEISRSPLLGEHTAEILREVLGFGQMEIDAFQDAGAFSKDPPKVAEYHPLRGEAA